MRALTRAPSAVVAPPRVAESPAALECRVHDIVRHGDGPLGSNYVIGEVCHVHVDDAVLRDGLPDDRAQFPRWAGLAVEPDWVEGLTARGRTILFVSHDLGAVQALCDEGIWLDLLHGVRRGHLALHGLEEQIRRFAIDLECTGREWLEHLAVFHC